MPATRLIVVEDAPRLAELLQLNREFLAPWEPIRPDEYFTAEGQRRAIEDALGRYDQTVDVPYVILEQGEIVGSVTLSNIVGGPFQSCNVGYWVSSAHNGRGLATSAVRDIMRVAFLEWACTGSKQGRCWRTLVRSEFLSGTGSFVSASRRDISTSPAAGKTMRSTKFSSRT